MSESACMNSMTRYCQTDSSDLFFVLLRNTLWEDRKQIPAELSEAECLRLFAMAGKQAVAGLVFNALTDNNVKMPSQKVFEAIGLLEQIKQQNIKVSQGVCRLNELFTKTNVAYVVVKGQAVASYYPEQLLRQSGVIDYYCNNDNFESSCVA